MVNNCALLVFEFAAALGPSLWQLTNTSMLAEIAENASSRHRSFHILMAGSSSPLLPSVVRARSCTKPKPGDRLIVSSDNCARHPENRGGSPPLDDKHTR